MDLNKLTTSEKLIAGSGLVLFIASFLPWFKVSVEGLGSETGNGWDVGFLWAGLPALLGLAAAGIILATRLGSAQMPDLPVTWGQAFLAAGALSAFLVVLKLIIGEDEPAGADLLGVVDITRSFGLYLAALAALGFLAGGFLRMQEERGGTTAGGSAF